MEKKIGVRREDKNRWERRVPLIPGDVARLKSEHNINTVLQPAPLRIYTDDEYRQAGADLKEEMTGANTVFAVKEIPLDFFEQHKTYIFFSHVIKGQSYNMPMLQRMMDLETNLIDYEKIMDESGRRLIFFGRFAGLAGMIETLYAYGQKLKNAGIESPFALFKQAYEYDSLDAAKAAITAIGDEIKANGFPAEIGPLVCGFAGYGNVSLGAQEIFDLLPFREITPEELLTGKLPQANNLLYKVVFKEEHLVKSLAGDFDLQEYYNQPEKYTGDFDRFIPNLTLLVNCIFWTEQYPRLVTKVYLQANTDQDFKLKVIGDISCDIDGSIEITRKVTYPDQACFTYFPENDAFEDGEPAGGITVMAVDNLPCEFSRESSAEFSKVLVDYVNAIVEADFDQSLADLDLPFPIKKALILHRGKLTPDYEYIREYL